MNGRITGIEVGLNESDMKRAKALRDKIKAIPAPHLATVRIEPEDIAVLDEICSLFEAK